MFGSKGGVDYRWSEDTTDGLDHRAEIVRLDWGTFRAGETGHLSAQPRRCLRWSRMGPCLWGAALRYQLQLCLFVDRVVSHFNNHAQCCHEMP